MYWLIKQELKLTPIYCSLEAAGPVWKSTNIVDTAFLMPKLNFYLSLSISWLTNQVAVKRNSKSTKSQAVWPSHCSRNSIRLVVATLVQMPSAILCLLWILSVLWMLLLLNYACSWFVSKNVFMHSTISGSTSKSIPRLVCIHWSNVLFSAVNNI